MKFHENPIKDNPVAPKNETEQEPQPEKELTVQEVELQLKDKVREVFRNILEQSELDELEKAVKYLRTLRQTDFAKKTIYVLLEIYTRCIVNVKTLSEFQILLKILVDVGLNKDYAENSLAHENAHLNQFEIELRDGQKDGYSGESFGYSVVIFKEGKSWGIRPQIDYASTQITASDLESEKRITSAPRVNFDLLREYDSPFVKDRSLNGLDMSEGDKRELMNLDNKINQVSQKGNEINYNELMDEGRVMENCNRVLLRLKPIVERFRSEIYIPK